MAYLSVTIPGLSQPKTYPLDEHDPFTIGRSPENRLNEGGNGLSRRHAVVTYHEKFGVLKDLGSANGTYINGELITRPIILMNGDTFICGDLQCVYVDA